MGGEGTVEDGGGSTVESSGPQEDVPTAPESSPGSSWVGEGQTGSRVGATREGVEGREEGESKRRGEKGVSLR